MKIFLWELSWDIILTEGNFARQHVPTSPSCTLYGFAHASAFHTFFDCPFTRRVWRDFGIEMPNGFGRQKEPMDFLSDLFARNAATLKELIVVIAWGLWKKRCERTHGN